MRLLIYHKKQDITNKQEHNKTARGRYKGTFAFRIPEGGLETW